MKKEGRERKGGGEKEERKEEGKGGEEEEKKDTSVGIIAQDISSGSSKL